MLLKRAARASVRLPASVMAMVITASSDPHPLRA